jgi:hypothetical protein
MKLNIEQNSHHYIIKKVKQFTQPGVREQYQFEGICKVMRNF